MALTIPQLQSNLDAINQALGNPTLKVRFPDGREVTYRSVDELRKAKAEIEEDACRLTEVAAMVAHADCDKVRDTLLDQNEWVMQ